MGNATAKGTMTDSPTNIDYKKRPAVILLGLVFIGFCLWFCTATIYSVFDGAFLSMGGMFMVTIAPGAAFGAFGMVRFWSYADNAAEAWGALTCIFSAIALCISGMTVSFLVATFLPEEVDYRSLDLEGYKFLYIMIVLPLTMVWFDRLRKRMGLIPASKKRPLIQFLRQNWLKDILVTGLLYVVLTVSAFTWIVIDPPSPLSEKHLSYEKFYRREGFPADGSDFCYIRFNSAFYCDFALSEESFQQWAKAHADWATYNISPDRPVEVGWDEKFEIANGLVATRENDEKNHVSEEAVFDRDNNRVYYRRLIH